MSSCNVAEAALHFNSGLESGSSHSPPFFPCHRFFTRHLSMLHCIALALNLYLVVRPCYLLRVNDGGLILLALVALRRPIYLIRFHLTCLKELFLLYRL